MAVTVANPKLEAMAREHRQFSDPSHPHHEVYTGAFMNHYDKHGDVVDSHRAAINAVTTPPKEKQLTLASRFRYHENKRLNTEELLPPEKTETILRIARGVLRSRAVPVTGHHENLLAKHIARYNINKDNLGQNIDTQG